MLRTEIHLSARVSRIKQRRNFRFRCGRRSNTSRTINFRPSPSSEIINLTTTVGTRAVTGSRCDTNYETSQRDPERSSRGCCSRDFRATQSVKLDCRSAKRAKDNRAHTGIQISHSNSKLRSSKARNIHRL